MGTLTQIAALGSIIALAGCGLTVPEKELLGPNERDQFDRSTYGKGEARILANIRCQITKGLYEAPLKKYAPWLETWGSKITLTLNWDEQSTVAPGLRYGVPIGNGAFALAAGLSASAHATREETITFTLAHSQLLDDARRRVASGKSLDCSGLQDGATVNSDLKLDEFIYDKVTIAGTTVVNQFSNFQETLTFVVAFGGGVTPVWNLRRFNINSGGVFGGATRSKTSSIVLTLGPLEKPEKKGSAAQLNRPSEDQHNAAVVGSSTASAIRSQRQ